MVAIPFLRLAVNPSLGALYRHPVCEGLRKGIATMGLTSVMPLSQCHGSVGEIAYVTATALLWARIATCLATQTMHR